jgi:hypothetical protein
MTIATDRRLDYLTDLVEAADLDIPVYADRRDPRRVDLVIPGGRRFARVRLSDTDVTVAELADHSELEHSSATFGWANLELVAAYVTGLLAAVIDDGPLEDDGVIA